MPELPDALPVYLVLRLLTCHYGGDSNAEQAAQLRLGAMTAAGHWPLRYEYADQTGTEPPENLRRLLHGFECSDEDAARALALVLAYPAMRQDFGVAVFPAIEYFIDRAVVEEAVGEQAVICCVEAWLCGASTSEQMSVTNKPGSAPTAGGQIDGSVVGNPRYVRIRTILARELPDEAPPYPGRSPKMDLLPRVLAVWGQEQPRLPPPTDAKMIGRAIGRYRFR